MPITSMSVKLEAMIFNKSPLSDVGFLDTFAGAGGNGYDTTNFRLNTFSHNYLFDSALNYMLLPNGQCG